MGKGTIIKNSSANASYGKGLIINSCQFEGFGRYNEYPLYLGTGNILSNNKFEMTSFVYPIYVAGSNCSISGNQFISNSSNTNAIFNMVGSDNIFEGNRYINCTKVWTGQRNNRFDNKYKMVGTKTTVFNMDFSEANLKDVFYNGASNITLTSANFSNIPTDAEFELFVNQNTVVLDSSIVIGGTSIGAGKLAHFKYINALNKFAKI